jgi:nicotinate-nucleotide pyrophosphorylase (carboxylating)
MIHQQRFKSDAREKTERYRQTSGKHGSLLWRRVHRLAFYTSCDTHLVRPAAEAFFHTAQLAVCPCVVPALHPYGHISIPCLAKRHKRIPGQGRTYHFLHPARAQHAVVLRFLRVKVTSLGSYRNSPFVDGNPTDYDQFLPRFQDRFTPAGTLYTLGQLCYCPESLDLPIEPLKRARRRIWISMRLNDHLPEVEEIVQRALDEDLAGGDVTTDPLIPAHTHGSASFVAKAQGTIAGTEVAGLVFTIIDPFLKFSILINDGSEVKPGDVIAIVEGNVPGILKGERTALNFLQHMSGIATLTASYVRAVSGLSARILDTRKTVPGLRILEKYAVSAGGGTNHRLNLGDMVLIKDNHIAILRRRGLGIGDIVRQARDKTPRHIKIEIETTTAREAREAAQAGADVVMLDNMGLDEMRQAVALIDHKAIVEASGGVNLDNVRATAETGVDWISVGALTHSARALDINLELIV